MRDKPIRVFEPQLGGEELVAVGQVFGSKWIGRGEVVKEFEGAWAAHIQSKPENVRSISCATEGLFQAMSLLGVGKGDEVVLPTISFVGAANAVVAAGAKPVFCDVDPRTLSVTAEDVAAKVGKRTKAIILNHYGGLHAQDTLDICLQWRRRGVKVVEDAACVPASRGCDKPSGTFGDLGIWSFDAMKILSTGDGGMVWCRDHRLAKRLSEETYLGLGEESGSSSKAKDRWWEFEVACAGRRAIMNDISAAIGLRQLAKLPGFVEHRRGVFNAYYNFLRDHSWLTLPPNPEPGASSHYLFWVQLPHRVLRDKLARHLRGKGIYTTFRYHPLHKVKFYGSKGRLPNAELAADTTLCLPQHHGLSQNDVARVCDAVWQFRKKA